MSDIKQRLTEVIVKNFETNFTEQYDENDWRRLKGVRVQEPLNWLIENIDNAIDLAIEEERKRVVEMIEEMKNSDGKPKNDTMELQQAIIFSDGYYQAIEDLKYKLKANLE